MHDLKDITCAKDHGREMPEAFLMLHSKDVPHAEHFMEGSITDAFLTVDWKGFLAFVMLEFHLTGIAEA